MKLNNPNLWTAVLFLVGTGLQLGGYQSKVIANACLVGAAGLLVYSATMTASVPGGFTSKWRASWLLRFGGFLTLHDAARVAYEAARKNDTLWAHAAERLGTDSSPDGVLDYVATYFGMFVPIIGKRPPATTDEQITSLRAGNGTFSAGGRRLEMNDGKTVFTDLRVKASDVRQVVAKMSEKVFPDGKA